MKNKIKKWLEVPDTEIKIILSDELKKKIQEEVIKVVEDAFSPKPILCGGLYSSLTRFGHDDPSLQGLIETYIARYFEERADDALRCMIAPIQEKLYGENFIDELIERINKKQLQ